MEWIPWSISGISLLVAVLSFIKNTQKDDRERIIEDAGKIDTINQSLIKANMKLDASCQSLTELRLDVKALSQSINDMDRRVTILERDVKTAFIRIDELKEGRT